VKIKYITDNKELIKQLTIRDITARYRGSAGGILWSLINPLIMLAVYSIVFAFVFKAKFGEAIISGESSRWDFSIMLFSGLIIHGFFAEAITKSTTLVTSNVSFVKKVIFPLEILPVVNILSALFHLLISTGILSVAFLIFYHSIPITILFVPLVLLPFIIMVLGISYFLSSLGVYIRDLQHPINILMTVLLFISPIFFSISALPELVQPFVYLNPLSVIVEEFRNVILLNKLPNFLHLGLYYIVALMTYMVGFIFFSKTKNGFADVI
jgi:lipopolysaccharide transport system permease protein